MKGFTSVFLLAVLRLTRSLAVLQRVLSASVTIDKQLISSIGCGILVFAAVERDDTRQEVEAMASKVLKLKLWPDDTGGTVHISVLGALDSVLTFIHKWKKSVLDIKAEVLCGTTSSFKLRNVPIQSDMAVVSQFTLAASTKKGNKPDFHGAAGGEKAKELYDYFFAKVQDLYEPEKVKNGVFQAMMEVGLVNDGPVGVEYHSHDGVVNPEFHYPAVFHFLKADSGQCLGHNRDSDNPTKALLKQARNKGTEVCDRERNKSATRRKSS
ncbi:D-tyrosyl-tRNA(Tyr) deacylase [Xylographa trunciseda]|nr:D-tyrosyl-tRNA(Tyr) deacylase [Xylographa trunciseda]